MQIFLITIITLFKNIVLVRKVMRLRTRPD